MQELNYPFDSSYLLKKKRRLKRMLLEEPTKRVQKKIAVLGGSTTNDIVDMLELFLLNEGIAPTFFQCEYAQYWQEAMFPSEELLQFAPDIIFIHTTTRNITEAPLPLNATEQEVQEALERQYQHFETMWTNLKKTFSCTIIQNNFELPSYRLMGNRDAWDPHGMVWFVQELNRKFGMYASKHQDFYIHDIHYLSASYGLDEWQDAKYWYLYKYAMTLNAIPDFAYSLTRIIRSLLGKNKKVLALDLDNTLWGGVIGDDGQEGIEIGQETAMAEAYTEMQEYCKAQKQLGVLLGVCSKNEPENALLGLNHPDSVLKEEDFVSIHANWEPKDKNLLDMAQELTLLPESFVFVDDNPAERDIVQGQIPGIAVAEFEAPTEMIRAIDRAGYFETTTFSEDDAKRTAQYQANARRSQLQQSYGSYTDYLLGLEMLAEIQDFTPVALPRIVQLTNKSNQFNVTTKRYTQSEMEQVTQDESYVRLYGRLKDKFGDNGIVSVVIGKQEEQTLHIELWLMSCRVLKRDMELAMLDTLVEQCQKRQITEIRGYYYPTAKNKMVAELFGQFGFTKLEESENGDTVWSLDLTNYEKKNHVITVEGEEK